MIQIFKKPKIIASSEIGEYVYCPVGWYLHRTGHAPQSARIVQGTLAHFDMGLKVKKASQLKALSKIFKYLGLVILLGIVALILMGWL